MQPLPAFIMFTVTAAIVAVFLIPASYERKSALVNFYWVGTWLFLALLAAISGGEQIVRTEPRRERGRRPRRRKQESWDVLVKQ